MSTTLYTEKVVIFNEKLGKYLKIHEGACAWMENHSDATHFPAGFIPYAIGRFYRYDASEGAYRAIGLDGSFVITQIRPITVKMALEY